MMKKFDYKGLTIQSDLMLTKPATFTKGSPLAQKFNSYDEYKTWFFAYTQNFEIVTIGTLRAI